MICLSPNPKSIILIFLFFKPRERVKIEDTKGDQRVSDKHKRGIFSNRNTFSAWKGSSIWGNAVLAFQELNFKNILLLLFLLLLLAAFIDWFVIGMLLSTGLVILIFRCYAVHYFHHSHIIWKEVDVSNWNQIPTKSHENLYSRSRLMWSLWARLTVTTLTEWYY